MGGPRRGSDTASTRTTGQGDRRGWPEGREDVVWGQLSSLGAGVLRPVIMKTPGGVRRKPRYGDNWVLKLSAVSTVDPGPWEDESVLWRLVR